MISEEFRTCIKVKQLPHDKFDMQSVKYNKPIHITAKSDLENTLTPEIIQQLHGNDNVNIGIFDLNLDRNFPQERPPMLLKDAIELFKNNPNPKLRYYLMEHEIDTHFPKLIAYLDHLKPLFPDKKMIFKLWFGEKSNISPLHYDAMHNLLYQAFGSKRILAFSPTDTPYLYPNTDLQRFNYSKVDDFSTLNTTKFPLTSKATPYLVTLHPGDILFLPSGWWHHATSLDLSITIPCWWKPEINESTMSHIFRLKAWESYDNNCLYKLKQFFDIDATLSSLELAKAFNKQRFHWLCVIYIAEYLREKKIDPRSAHSNWHEIFNTARKEQDNLLSTDKLDSIIEYLEKEYGN